MLFVRRVVGRCCRAVGAAVRLARAGGVRSSWSTSAETGQATAEYALVLLGAAAVALLLIGWATTTDQVSRLFDFVVDQVIGRSG